MSQIPQNAFPQLPSVVFPDLHGKTALVTGASRGIGKAVIDLLLAQGTRCFGISTKPTADPVDNLVRVACDLSDADAIATGLEQIRAQTESLDYIVNVAGIDPKYKIDEVTADQWDFLMDLNLRAYYLLIKHSMPLLRAGSGKSIVNVSSINYRLGVPGRAAYSASKAGILGLTTGLSRELGQEHIRVNTVTPGWTFTQRQVDEYFSGENEDKYLTFLFEQQALQLKVQSEDIAMHILFYLSAASRASTGHNCVVDGGWLLE